MTGGGGEVMAYPPIIIAYITDTPINLIRSDIFLTILLVPKSFLIHVHFFRDITLKKLLLQMLQFIDQGVSGVNTFNAP